MGRLGSSEVLLEFVDGLGGPVAVNGVTVSGLAVQTRQATIHRPVFPLRLVVGGSVEVGHTRRPWVDDGAGGPLVGRSAWGPASAKWIGEREILRLCFSRHGSQHVRPTRWLEAISAGMMRRLDLVRCRLGGFGRFGCGFPRARRERLWRHDELSWDNIGSAQSQL